LGIGKKEDRKKGFALPLVLPTGGREVLGPTMECERKVGIKGVEKKRNLGKITMREKKETPYNKNQGLLEPAKVCCIQRAWESFPTKGTGEKMFKEDRN